MAWIDTHTHLFLKEFDEDRKEVVARCIQNDVTTLLLPNIDVSTLDSMKNMVDEYPLNTRLMLGLHPGSVKADWLGQLKVIESKIAIWKPIAIGEIGMDLYWDKTYQKEQVLAFKQQIEWAKKHDLPIVIHAREAFEEIFEVLDEVIDNRLRGVFHCFTGTIQQAEKIMAYPNFMMGIGGVVTYKKAAMEEVLKHVPLEYLVLETDSPYLSPVPYRGKRNESSYLVQVASKLAEIYNLPLRQIEQLTTHNAQKLFRI